MIRGSDTNGHHRNLHWALLIGFAVDRMIGDPARLHPVAGFGRVAATLERRIHRDSVAVGGLQVTLLAGGAIGLGVAAERLPAPSRFVATSAVTWAVLGGRSLANEARAVSGLLDRGELTAARRRLTHLVGRCTDGLSPDEVARAVVESVAENTSDAVVAPLFWGAVAGIPGLLGYRAINTLDAMIGHRSARYERFGKVAARLDDAVNWLPARVSGLLVAACAPGRADQSLRCWLRDADGHPSPNAGVVESAFAGALGLRLGGTNDYGGRIEHRVTMGTGRPPTPADIAPAVALADRVGAGAIAAAVLLGLARRRLLSTGVAAEG